MYQPDGTSFEACLIGDEFARGYVTIDDGYAIKNLNSLSF
jgi:hypothetical protein